LLAREVPRPTAASARRSEYDSAATVVGSDRTLALNVEIAGSLASHGKARNRFVTHFNAFTRIAIISNLVPWTHQVFYVKSAPICLRQPSRLNVILFAFPDHSRTEKVSDVSCLSRGLRRAPVSDEAPR